MRPNKSFKPTPHRGVNSVLCATLHAVAAPLWGGLTLALGSTIVASRVSWKILTVFRLSVRLM